MDEYLTRYQNAQDRACAERDTDEWQCAYQKRLAECVRQGVPLPPELELIARTYLEGVRS